MQSIFIRYGFTRLGSTRHALPIIAATAMVCTGTVQRALAAENQPSAAESAVSDAGSDQRIVEEVVVTAQKREQSTLDVPIAITALSAAQLEKLNLTSMYDLSLTTPGFVTASQAGNSIPFLRGVGSTIAFTGSDSSVSTYVDGYYISYDQGTMQELFDAERIEVLKGPQATLYGRNATGGAINFISKKPNTNEFEGKIGVGFGSESKQELQAYLTGPLTDTLAFSVAAMGRRRDSYIQVEAPVPQGLNTDESRYAARVKLLWQPSESYQAELSASYSNKDSFEDAVYIPVRGSDLEAVAIGAPVTYADTNTLLTGTSVRNDVNQTMLFLTQNFTFFGGTQLRSLTGFTDTKQNADIPLGGSSVPILSVGDYDTGLSKDVSCA
jgi:outer membrane receptor protein involved in Fe transport